MIHTGLVSVTFRQLLPEEIIALVKQAGLEAIEWGGDIHVPHGDLHQAARVRIMTQDAGLKVAAYGSYYHVGCPPGPDNPPFEAVLETALALQAPTIRVWAGDRASRDADPAWRQQVIRDSRRIADLASGHDVFIAYEYHEDTLTDTAESAVQLLKDVDHPTIRSYWQMPVDLSLESSLEGLQKVLPWLANIHIYFQTGEDRKILSDGLDQWARYMKWIKDVPGDRYGLLEFVLGDTPDQFMKDAITLKQICS